MSTKQEIITNLRERIGAIEWLRTDTVTSYPLGIAEIDASLKYGGLTAGSCHEIISAHDGPALGFLLLALSSMVKHGPALWCSSQTDFYTPGFLPFGIADTDIMFIKTPDQKQSLWATEVALSCNKVSAVVLSTKQLSLAQGRRLKLLAHKHNTTAIFLMKPHSIKSATIATTRWHISPAPSLGLPSRNATNCVGARRLSITLLRNLYGLAPLSWMVEFNEHTLRFHTVPSLLPSTKQTSSPRSLAGVG